MATDVAKVHLAIYGQQHEIELEVRVGEVTLDDLFQPAKEICERVSAIAVARAAAEGETVTCSRGCDACCRQLVPISLIEARRLAVLVAKMPEDRQAIIRRRFADLIAALEKNGLLDVRARGRSAMITDRQGDTKTLWLDVSRRYFELGIPCPFIEDQACSIYPDRPLVCREFLITTPPERCATFGGATRSIDRPVRMSEALAGAAHALLGVQATQIPLALSLEWAELHGTTLDVPQDGEKAFFSLVEAAQEEPKSAPSRPRKPGKRAKATRRSPRR